jgi:hypothetical protein
MGRLNLIFVAGLETFPIAKMQQSGVASQSETGSANSLSHVIVIR